MSEKVMLTVIGWEKLPSLEEVAAELGLPLEACDPAFGVIAVDPDRGTYAIRVDRDRVPGKLADDPRVKGPFSDPRIAPFGPPIKDAD